MVDITCTQNQYLHFIIHLTQYLSSDWLTENVQCIFEISPCDVIHSVAADYTKIMSKTLKFKGNHVMYDCGA